MTSSADDLDRFIDAGAWVSLATALCGLLFIIAYASLARWWKSIEGRMMMAFAFAVTSLSGYTFMVVKVVPDSELLRLVRIVIVVSMGLLMLAQTALLIKAQTRRRKEA